MVTDLFHLDDTLGALIISTMITSALYGVTTIQTYVYFQRSEKDSTLLKSMIACLWILDTVHQVFICHACYTYAITDYSDLLALTKETWYVIGVIFITATLNVVLRSVFCLRIWQFNDKKWFLVAIIMLCSFAEFGLTMAFGLRDQIGLHAQFLALHSLAPDVYIGLVFSIIADLTVACSQVVLLWRRRSTVSRTNSLLRTLMLYSISTGAVTTVCALLQLITFASMPNNLVYIAFFTALPVLLFNALLATLNARQSLRDIAGMNGEPISIPLSTVTPSSSAVTAHVGPFHSGQNHPIVSVHVSKEIKLDRMEDMA
ncbi:hypothetical protein OBBRIDRAFT_776407 [Obba rivulosa]|uniref:DUF6534 domain-containing protein n=1 Tax=Obba rivulosa TaxID=1052685 RepID=A0A8E2AUF7_9APHY|nr:hypothetical protein OBBRIDRAFT_776407 [Obba rivulosa]